MLRLFFEGYVRAIDHSAPWQDFSSASLQEWLPPLERVLAGTPVPATLALAVLRGLLLDPLADDSHADRVDAAWLAFLDTTFGPGNGASD
ncbi:hypothetical protein [Kitasatospora sp. NPDC051914]|uniref:hypothetical protein n=1 Tax=Kitasatospora sp. NPDC051914 TaxID=3154945 RepID=UPI00343A6017